MFAINMTLLELLANRSPLQHNKITKEITVSVSITPLAHMSAIKKMAELAEWEVRKWLCLWLPCL